MQKVIGKNSRVLCCHSERATFCWPVNKKTMERLKCTYTAKLPNKTYGNAIMNNITDIVLYKQRLAKVKKVVKYTFRVKENVNFLFIVSFVFIINS